MKYLIVMLMGFLTMLIVLSCADQYDQESTMEAEQSLELSTGEMWPDTDEMAPNAFTAALNDHYKVTDIYEFTPLSPRSYSYEGVAYVRHKGKITQTLTGYIIEDEVIGI